jgi:hypothetical protein
VSDEPNWRPNVDAEEETARRLVLTPASSIRLRRVRWLWDTTPEGAPPTSHGRIPLNSLAIAAGGPGLGKSQFAVWLTARITTGTLPGELYGKPRGVIYAATEDSWSYTIAPRLVAAGANMDLVFRVDVRDDEEMHARLTLPKDISLMGKAAEAYSVGLLVAPPSNRSWRPPTSTTSPSSAWPTSPRRAEPTRSAASLDPARSAS